MRLTYQIRLLTYFASKKGLILSNYLPSEATVHLTLEAFCAEHPTNVLILRQ
jgi:hypothetical protein